MKATFVIDANNRLQINHEPESHEEGILLRLWQIDRSANELEQARALLEKLLGREVRSATEGIEALNHLRGETIRRLEQDVAEARRDHFADASKMPPTQPLAVPLDSAPKRRNHVSDIGRAHMQLNARLSPQSAQAIRDLAAKGHGPEEIASRQWISAAGKMRRFNVQMIKNVLKGAGAAPQPVAIAAEASEPAADDSEEESAPPRRPPPHSDCRGVIPTFKEPAWARPGAHVPMPSYAGSWAFPAGRAANRTER
jgi:hypothetical protein